MSKNWVKDAPGKSILLAMIFLSLPACDMQRQERKVPKIVATNPQVRAVTIAKRYPCQINSHHHINIRSSAKGNLELISVKKGQTVHQGDLLFRVVPVHEQAKREVAVAEAKLAKLHSSGRSRSLPDSQGDAAVTEAMPDQTKVVLTSNGLNLTDVNAPFEGIVDNFKLRQGSPVQRGDILATLSDNSMMWVYFNVPEAGYLEYMVELKREADDLKIELLLWNDEKFDHMGKISTIEAGFNHETGTIPFRADFPNPDRQLRHGQRGTVLISRQQHDALVIPQRAAFEVLNKRYVFVIDSQNVARQREVIVQNELDDAYVITSGLSVNDRIIVEGTGRLRDGDKVNNEVLAQK